MKKSKKQLTGSQIIDFIIKNKLVNVAGQKAVVFVWAANAPSQLDSLLQGK
jgi:hypothetical protein